MRRLVAALLFGVLWLVSLNTHAQQIVDQAACYAALTTFWATLPSGDTTAQKLALVQAATVTGTIPTTFPEAGTPVLDALSYPEFKALTAQQQANFLDVLIISNQQNIISGAGSFLSNMAVDYFGQPFTGTASASGTVLTVTVANGTIKVGMVVTGTGLTAVSIASLGTGTGGTGTYNLTSPGETFVSQSVLFTSQTITNFEALAKAQVQPWWYANECAGQITADDLAADGNLQ